MLNYVVDALLNCKRVENLVVVGPPLLRDHLPVKVRLIEAGSGLTENVLLGVNATEKKE